MLAAGEPTPRFKVSFFHDQRAEDAVQAETTEVGISSLDHKARVKLGIRARLVHRHMMICVNWGNYWDSRAI